MEWQDIETAPKDGTKLILVGEPHAHFYDSEDRCWTYGEVGVECVGEGYFFAGLWQRNGGTFKNPTHWMPLPSPPKPTHKDKDWN